MELQTIGFMSSIYQFDKSRLAYLVLDRSKYANRFLLGKNRKQFCEKIKLGEIK